MTHSSNEVSNLITDMTLAGASTDEIRRAVKYSMVVLDCEKSAEDNGIDELFEKYRGGEVKYKIKVIRELLGEHRRTTREVAEILGVPEGKISEALKEAANADG